MAVRWCGGKYGALTIPLPVPRSGKSVNSAPNYAVWLDGDHIAHYIRRQLRVNCVTRF